MEQQTGDGTETLSFAQKLRNGDRYWAYKMGLRAILWTAMAIGVGTTAWLVATVYGSDEYYSPGRYFGYIYSMDYIIMPFALPVIALSLIWSLITILVPLLRKSHRPVHPGTAVAFDLLLWLALLTTALFTLLCLSQIARYGVDGSFDDDSTSEYSAHYVHLSNGTWVWKLEHLEPSYRDPGYHYNYTTGNYTYSQGHTKADVTRDCSPYRSCEREDELVNQLWREKQHRYAVELTAMVVQFIGVILHFALFVWACVDTHRRNHNVKERVMREAANEAIRDMQARGMITIHDPAIAGRTAGPAETSQIREGEPGPSVPRQQASGGGIVREE